MLLLQATRRLCIAIFFAALASAALALMPMSSMFGPDVEPVLTVIIAGVFWGSLVLEQIFFWSANKKRKIIQKKAFAGKKLVKVSLGVFTFGANTEARFFDVLLLPSTILVVILSMLSTQLNMGLTAALSVLILSINLHCIFNGSTYRYIKAFQKIKKGAETNEKA